MKAASKPASPISSTICGSAMPPTWVPSARPPSRRMCLTRFSLIAPSLGCAHRLPPLQAGNDHVGVHHITKDVVEGSQRGVVLLLAIGGVAVADHDRAEIRHVGVPRRALAAYVGHGAGDQHRIEA